MIPWCWLAVACARMGPVQAGSTLEVRDIPEQISRNSNYVPWYRRMVLANDVKLEEEVRKLDQQKSLKLFRSIDANLKLDPGACLFSLADKSDAWRYSKHSDHVRQIPHVILLEWADLLLELFQKEQSKLKAAVKMINQMRLQNENTKDQLMWRSSFSSSEASLSSSQTGDEYLTKILGEIASAVGLDYESASSSKVIRTAKRVFEFASKSFEIFKSLGGTDFEPDFDTYLSKTADVEGDLTSFKNVMLESLESPKENQSLFVSGLMFINENLTQKLSETQELLSQITMEKAELEQDRLDTIEMLSPIVSVMSSSSLVPAVQILVEKANSPVNYQERLSEEEKKVSSLKVQNEEQSRLVQVSLIMVNQVNSEVADLSQKLERQQRTIQELEAKNLSEQNPNKEIKGLAVSSLEGGHENLSKSLEEYKELLARMKKENEDLQALVKDFKTSSQQQKPEVRYIYSSSSSSSSSSSCKTPAQTQQPVLITSHTFTEADIQRAVLAERALIPERCRVVGTANIAMFGSSLTLFAAGSGLIGYWYYMLRPVLALI